MNALKWGLSGKSSLLSFSCEVRGLRVCWECKRKGIHGRGGSLVEQVIPKYILVVSNSSNTQHEKVPHQLPLPCPKYSSLIIGCALCWLLPLNRYIDIIYIIPSLLVFIFFPILMVLYYVYGCTIFFHVILCLGGFYSFNNFIAYICKDI